MSDTVETGFAEIEYGMSKLSSSGSLIDRNTAHNMANTNILVCEVCGNRLYVKHDANATVDVDNADGAESVTNVDDADDVDDVDKSAGRTCGREAWMSCADARRGKWACVPKSASLFARTARTVGVEGRSEVSRA